MQYYACLHMEAGLADDEKVGMRPASGMCRIENEHGVRDLPWIGPALRHLDLSSNSWLATHHAYGLLGANDGSGAAINPGAASPGTPRC